MTMPELSRAVHDRLLAFDPPETPPFSVIRTRAKRRRQVQALVAVTAVAVAIGGTAVALGGQSPRATDSVVPYASPGATDDPDAQPLSSEQLQQALLTEADLPEGYQLRQPPETDAGAGCFRRFVALEQPQAATATARAHFEKGFGARLTQTLVGFATTAAAQERLADADALVTECPSFPGQNPDGSTTTFQVEAIPPQDVGDDSSAFTLTGRAPSADVVVTVHVVRLGSTVMLVSQGTFVSDRQALAQAVERGAERVEAAR